MTGATPHARGDIGRRVAARREALGLTREEVAERAGSAPSYIQYLEEQVATPGIAFMARLANALECTVQDLTGYTADLPEGTGRAGRDARLTELDEGECLRLLGTHGVGRIAFTTGDGPAAFPVNYQIDHGEIVFMTARDAAVVRTAGTEIAFEADHVDEAFSQGWSVLVVGPVRHVTEPFATRRLQSAMYTGPWAGEGRHVVMVLAPRRVTGRRIVVEGAPGAGGRSDGPA
ncbi:helix-turn-helix domain-containing protein [Streptomyces sp. NPDC012637]|uniref:helix-turn-helix domain-containing protein n=1 Tax=Streptomyces sp. NPDC012637 TaxID=3364842 RepID=UPI0036EF8585